MRRARFTEHQNIAVLKSVEAGRTVTECVYRTFQPDLPDRNSCSEP